MVNLQVIKKNGKGIEEEKNKEEIKCRKEAVINRKTVLTLTSNNSKQKKDRKKSENGTETMSEKK